ncbi:MAG: 50S ribosomal protein L24 [Candidatus Ratteibacteria bacterium]|nr:50S ribosomal protein L24 [Candidatus Ratteibacteria bacterium]
MSIYIKKGDTVLVICGKDKGKTAKVKIVLPKKNKVVLERINIAKRHTKPSQKNAQGGVIELEKPLNCSNVMVYCPKCAKGVKVGVKILTDKTKSRFCKKCGEIIGRA